ncbi:RDD family protein [Marinactinospora rubrisoli]|uniref:RDD family protein n=1 Tax=Marinactinospora rubrisoli TaxID=2715399 RepID=A0ABW2KDT5_9ACTN
MNYPAPPPQPGVPAGQPAGPYSGRPVNSGNPTFLPPAAPAPTPAPYGGAPAPGWPAPGEDAYPPADWGRVHVPSYGPQPARIWQRLLANMLDGFLATLIFYVFFPGLMLITALLMGGTPDDLNGVAILLTGPIAFLGGLTAYWCYFWLPVAKSGQTLGKRVLGIRVIDMETGLPPSKGRSALRLLTIIGLSAVSGIGTLIDAIIGLVDEPYHRTVHDHAGRTIVIAVPPTAKS